MITEYSNFVEVKHFFDSAVYVDTYKKVFRSREWLEAYCEVYSEAKNYIYICKHRNSYSFSFVNEKLTFTGDPFNDFNHLLCECILQDKTIHSYFRVRGIDSLTLSHLSTNLVDYTSGISYENSCILSLKDFEGKMSSSIYKMILKFKNEFTHTQIRMNKKDVFIRNLKKLLQFRRLRLHSNKMQESNESFSKNFDLFIVMFFELLPQNSIFSIEKLVRKSDKSTVAMALNFNYHFSSMGYLRAINQNILIESNQHKNRLSCGLLLDFAFLTELKKAGIIVYDYTRGDEFYKLRLGAKIYQSLNIKIFLDKNYYK